MTPTKGSVPYLSTGARHPFSKLTYRYETITDLMTLQDQIDTFQKLIFAHFRGGANNECRISALVPLVQESYGIYKFVTSMLRAMHTSTYYAHVCVGHVSINLHSHWR